MSARRPAVAVVLATLALGACTGLPAQTPIRTGRPVDGEVSDAIRVQVQGPVPGAAPRDVVSGFLRATTAFQDDASVAQEFLTPAGAAQWRPARVVVFESTAQPTVTVSGTHATVVVPVTGTLDEQGHYADAAPGTTTRLDLTLQQVDGQWRIAGGLTGFGAVMSRGDLVRYSVHGVEYLAPGGDAMVADRRWFLRGPGLLTRLARAVLEPPPPSLQGAVLTGVPSDIDLVGSVTLDDSGTATVQLADRVTDADERARRALWTRLVHTLQQAGEVARVQVLAGGSRLGVDGLPDRPLTTADLPVPTPHPRSDVAVVRTGTALSAVRLPDLSRVTPSAASLATSLPALPTAWYHLALAADTSELATTGGDDRDLARWRGGRRIAVPRVATGLTRPAYDRHGVLWVAGLTPGGPRLLVLDTAAAGTTAQAPTLLAVPWLDGRRVRAVEVADDGLRVAVVSTDPAGGTPRVQVAGVVRSGTRPVSLAAPRELVPGLAEAVDVTWVDADTLAVLGRRAGGGARRVVLVPLDDPSRDLGEVPGGESVTAYGGERNIAVVTGGNQVLVRSGSRFVPQLASRELAVPGH